MQRNFNFLVTVILFLFIGNVSAQSEGKDVVLLKNGDTLQGTIIEQRPGKHIKLLQQPSQDTLTVEYERIEALQYLPTTNLNVEDTLRAQNIMINADEAPAPKFNQRKNYLGVGVAGGGGVWTNVGIGGNFLYTINSKLQTGISLYFFQGVGQETVIHQALPVSIDALYTVGKTKSERFSSYVGTSLGYSFNLNEPPSNAAMLALKNGTYLNPFIGGRLNFSPNSGLRLDIGYQLVSGATFDKSTGDLLQKNKQHNILVKAMIFF